MSSHPPVRAVLWDFGGVILSSPFEAFNAYEAAHGLPRDFIRGINATNPHDNAWAKLESSRIGVDEFCRLFAAEAASRGHALDGRIVLSLLSGRIRPEMVAALRAVKRRYKTACLTNNVATGDGPGMARTQEQAAAVAEVMKIFDLVLESSKVGVRKPEPRFYEIACERLGVRPEEAVFLDDLGINLKPARDMGMRTIKVAAPAAALAELAAILGHPLD